MGSGASTVSNAGQRLATPLRATLSEPERGAWLGKARSHKKCQQMQSDAERRQAKASDTER